MDGATASLAAVVAYHTHCGSRVVSSDGEHAGVARLTCANGRATGWSTVTSSSCQMLQHAPPAAARVCLAKAKKTLCKR
jgi:hypothetical protein